MAIRRSGGRRADQLRPLTLTRGYTKGVPGSVLIRLGDTMVLCTACVEESVPPWRAPSGLGWVTAEYDMLPGSTGRRRPRARIKPDGRATEIQRLIGRSLRGVVDYAKLGPRSIWLDCDVLQADGGTRSASITGACVALADAVQWLLDQGLITESPLREPVAAVSAGKIGGRILLDLDYAEDSKAEVDFNVVMTASGQLVEVQGGAEGGTFTQAELGRMLKLAGGGIRQLVAAQKQALGGKPGSRGRKTSRARHG